MANILRSETTRRNLSTLRPMFGYRASTSGEFGLEDILGELQGFKLKCGPVGDSASTKVSVSGITSSDTPLFMFYWYLSTVHTTVHIVDRTASVAFDSTGNVSIDGGPSGAGNDAAWLFGWYDQA